MSIARWRCCGWPPRGTGDLTVTEVAARLGWPMEMALATLRSVEDGVRVTSTVTADGVLLFQFRELMHDPPASPTPIRRPSRKPS